MQDQDGWKLAKKSVSSLEVVNTVIFNSDTDSRIGDRGHGCGQTVIYVQVIRQFGETARVKAADGEFAFVMYMSGHTHTYA